MNCRKIAAIALVLALLSIPGAAAALTSGPTLMGGFVRSPQKIQSSGGDTVTINPMAGPSLRVGYELGTYVNHELSFQFTQVGGTAYSAAYPAIPAELTLKTLALGYRLTWDILGKSGFSPYLGGGLALGTVPLEVKATSGAFTAMKSGSATLLELSLVAGARYTLPFGLNLRAELAVSTYGGFFGTLLPAVGVGYTL